MPALRLVKLEDANGNTVNLRISRIIEIDGKPFIEGVETPSADSLLSRVTLLEAHVTDLVEFKKALLDHKPESSP